jgi:hypothetical protein
MREQEFMISPTVMVTAEYEMDYETIDQRANDIGLGVQTLHFPTQFRAYSTDDEWTNDIQAILGQGIYDGSHAETESKISEFLTNKGIPFIIANLKGFSQGEWHDMVIYSPDKSWTTEQLEGVAEEFDALFAGEVYRVEVLNAKTYTARDGDTVIKWIHDDSFGYTQVTEKLFTLNADFIKETFNLEVVIEVEG